MQDIHLFGATTIIGEDLSHLIKENYHEFNLISYSRSKKDFHQIDILNKSSINNLFISDNSTIINYSPIWDFSIFIRNIYLYEPEKLKGVKSIISTSSSSVETKRYSLNRYDKDLVKKLLLSEKQVQEICIDMKINCTIIRPTLIYGSSVNYKDKNINQILNIMSSLPFILLPNHSGLRQPIHSSQLAKVTLKYMNTLQNSSSNIIEKVEVGGDMQISYEKMIAMIQSSLPTSHKAKYCKIVLINNKIFITLALPLAWLSLKLFEALLRISSDLAGFTPSHKILKSKPLKFPVQPFL